MTNLNILFCSAGRRGKLIKNFKESLQSNGKIIATDMSNSAPALYFADGHYIVPKIDSEEYIPTILDICKREEINVITTLIDPEIKKLAENREKFLTNGITVLAPDIETASLCFDKYKMYKYLVEKDIDTVLTFADFESFEDAYRKNDIKLPVFVKPRDGSGSVGVRVIDDIKDLEIALNKDKSLIVQEYMSDYKDIDVDAYVDTISNKLVSFFSKKKLETRIGGASKTISFIDEALIEVIDRIVSEFRFFGPIDMDFWYKDGKYILSEINPRFGGAYIHAYAAGVNFADLIYNNTKGKENKRVFNNYKANLMMMMYDDAVFIEND